MYNYVISSFRQIIAIAFILSLVPLSSAYATITFGKDCEKEIVFLIENSNHSIDIAVYAINNTNIINALVMAKNKNVKIRILTDRLQAFGRGSRIKFLDKNGFDIKLNSKMKTIHHKFAVFDKKLGVMGSFNWTGTAANKNAEDCNIFTIEEDVKALEKRFDYLWQINSQVASDCYVKRLQTGVKTKCHA